MLDNLLVYLSWFGTALVLCSYAWSIHTKRPEVFHVANVVASGLLGVYNASLGAWPSVVLNAFFGLIGAFGIYSWLRAGGRRQEATAMPSSPSRPS